MKPEIDFRGKTELKRQIEQAKKVSQKLRFAERTLLPVLEKADLRVPMRVSLDVSSYSVSVFFDLVSEKPTDEESSLAVADVVKLFDVRLERKFGEYSGKFYWVGTKTFGDTGVSIFINRVSPGKCTIKKTVKTVTREEEVYEAHCDD